MHATPTYNNIIMLLYAIVIIIIIIRCADLVLCGWCHAPMYTQYTYTYILLLSIAVHFSVAVTRRNRNRNEFKAFSSDLTLIHTTGKSYTEYHTYLPIYIQGDSSSVIGMFVLMRATIVFFNNELRKFWFSILYSMPRHIIFSKLNSNF